METFQLFKAILETLSYIAVVLGIPIAVVEYKRTKKKEQLDRDYGTYNALDDKFIEFQKLCLQYPYLDVFHLSDEKPVALTGQQIKEELIALTWLISIFERAFLMYSHASNEAKEKQKPGWDMYINEYCKRKNFIAAWNKAGGAFDTEFVKYIEDTIKTLANAKDSKQG